MTTEQQRIAIAEACGWTDITWFRLHAGNEDYWGSKCIGRDEYATRHRIPDYLNDLNAMHEAVMAQPEVVRVKINGTLMDMLHPESAYILDRTINATAAQRAEAWLRTRNLWTD